MMNLLHRFSGSLVPLVAALAALAVGAVVIIVLGANPLVGYGELVKGAFGSGDALADTAVRAMPLLLVGTGICIAFRASVINIGGEGQIVAGALLSTVTALAVPNLPAIVLIPVVMLAGIIGGGIWGAIPGALKAYLGVNEILSTIMLNIVAIQVMNYLLRDPLIDPLEIERGTRIPQTERLSENADLPILIEGTRLTPRCGDRPARLGGCVGLLVAHDRWVQDPGGRAQLRGRQLRGHALQAHDHAGAHLFGGDVWPGRCCAGVRKPITSADHRRIVARVHRIVGVQRNRRRAVRRASPAMDYPVVVPVRRSARWRERHAASHPDRFGVGHRPQRSDCGVRGEQYQCA